MAWRIHESVTRAEFDFRVAGKVLGRLWLHGLEEPVLLVLDGLPEADLRGQELMVHNPKPTRAMDGNFSGLQEGKIGVMTASRKVKVLEIPMEQVEEYYKERRKMPWHWGNSLYLEWYSAANGRVVFEAAEMELRMNGEVSVIAVDESDDEEDEDAPTSQKEAEAETYAEYMNALVERVALRLEDEMNDDDYETIFADERKKLRKQFGIQTVDAAEAEVQEGQEDWVAEVLEHYAKGHDIVAPEDWQKADDFEDFEDESDGDYEDGDDDEEDDVDWDVEEGFITEDSHPLVNHCLQRSEIMHRDMQENNWLPDIGQEDHPMDMLHQSVMFAGVKLSSALMDALEVWPPAPAVAGHVLVGLKAARRKFRDAILALQSCMEEGLADEAWLRDVENDVRDMLAQVTELIEESRAVLAVLESDD
jgi:hypothetical protein